jgi:hypothetical protein
MPTDATLGGHALVAKFDDKDAAHIACSMLREAGIACEEEVKYRVIVANLAPEQLDRAKILMENAGAAAIAEEYREIPPAAAQPGIADPSPSVAAKPGGTPR